jgi:bifunctional non-homologous end joining protein LigD
MSEEAITVAGVRISHPDKVLFMDQGLTKRALAEYLVKVAKRMLPFAANHPLTLVRCPQGVSGHCFYQRHITDGMPGGFYGIKVAEAGGEKAEYLYIKDVQGLVGAAQIGALELHVWGAPVTNVERPDRLVIDLDPSEEVGFAEVRTAAEDIRKIFKAAGLASFPLITGGKGIHVIAPLAGRNSWDEVKSFGEAIARTLELTEPQRFVANARKSKRKGRIYIDWLRNDRTSTAIAPYSPRAREGAPVAVPLSWMELRKVESAHAYTTETIVRRLAGMKKDPWQGYQQAGRISREMLSAAWKALNAA